MKLLLPREREMKEYFRFSGTIILLYKTNEIYVSSLTNTHLKLHHFEDIQLLSSFILEKISTEHLTKFNLVVST